MKALWLFWPLLELIDKKEFLPFHWGCPRLTVMHISTPGEKLCYKSRCSVFGITNTQISCHCGCYVYSYFHLLTPTVKLRLNSFVLSCIPVDNSCLSWSQWEKRNKTNTQIRKQPLLVQYVRLCLVSRRWNYKVKYMSRMHQYGNSEH